MELKKKIKTQSQAFIAALLLALVLLIINFLSSRHFVRLDLTEDHEYTLSPATKKVLKGLSDPLSIKLFMSQDLPPNMAPLQQGILDQLGEYMSLAKSKITIQRVLPEESPQREQEAQMLGIPPLQLDVLQKDKRQVMKVYMGLAVFYFDKKEVLPVVLDLKQFEYDLTAAILKITAEKIPQIGLVLPSQSSVGQGGDYSILQQILGREYQVQMFDDEIEEGAVEKLSQKNLDLLILVEPRHVSEVFTKELDLLFQKGVPLIIMAGSVDVGDNLLATSYSTGLEEWLKKYGIELSSQLVIDPKNHTYAAFSSGYMQYHIPYPFFVKVIPEGLNKNHAVTSNLEGLVFPWTNALTFNQQSHPDWTYDILAASSNASFVQEGPPNVNPTVLEETQVDQTDKQILSLLITAPPQIKDGRASRLLLVSNNNFIRDNALNDYDSNILLALNSVDWMSWGDNLIGIRSRGKTDRPLQIPSQGAITFIKFFHVMGIPLLFSLFGILLGILRKRRWVSLKV